NLAVERGEEMGRGGTSWASIQSSRPTWMQEKAINILVQIGPRKEDELADVPLLSDLIANDDDRAVLGVISLPLALGHPYCLPAGRAPGRPPGRRGASRRAPGRPPPRRGRGGRRRGPPHHHPPAIRGRGRGAGARDRDDAEAGDREGSEAAGVEVGSAVPRPGLYPGFVRHSHCSFRSGPAVSTCGNA